MKRTLVLLAGRTRGPGEHNLGCTDTGEDANAPEALYDAAFRDTVLRAEGLGGGPGETPPRLVLAYHGERAWFEQRTSSQWLLLPQMGFDLGQHLDNLLIVLGNAAEDRTIFIGPCTPHLPLRTLESGFISLGQRDVLVGPREQAGVYLIGVRGRWPSGLLRGVRWHTPHARADLLKKFRSTRLSVGLLEESYTVRGDSDLRRLKSDFGVFPDRSLPNLRRLAEKLPDELD